MNLRPSFPVENTTTPSMSHADIEARMVLRTALTLDDVAGAAFGTSEYFHTESFAF